MMIIRDTHEKCLRVKNVLQTHMVRYEERDIFMSRETQRELAERLGTKGDTLEVPQVFVDGQILGVSTCTLCAVLQIKQYLARVQVQTSRNIEMNTFSPLLSYFIALSCYVILT